MADTLLHATIATRLIRDNRALHRLVASEMESYLTGAVAFDLPYFENLLVSGISRLRGHPPVYHPVGQRIHALFGRDLCIEVVSLAHTPSQWAFALGIVSHFVIDVVFHREIALRVCPTAGITHADIEDDIGLFCHFDLLGHSGVGTRYCLDTLCLHPPAQWEAFWCDTLSITGCRYSATHSPKAHLRALRCFGVLHGWAAFPWVKTIPDDNPELGATSLALLDEALTEAARVLDALAVHYPNSVPRHIAGELLAKKRMSDGIELIEY